MKQNLWLVVEILDNLLKDEIEPLKLKTKSYANAKWDQKQISWIFHITNINKFANIFLLLDT